MKLLTSYLPPKIRSAVRFAVVGTTGMFVQTWIFMAALLLFDHPDKGAAKLILRWYKMRENLCMSKNCCTFASQKFEI